MGFKRGVDLDSALEIIFLRVGQEEVLSLHIRRQLRPAKEIDRTHVEVLDHHGVVFVLILLYLIYQRSLFTLESVSGDC